MEVRLARVDELDAVGAISVAAYEQFMLGPRDPYRARVRDAATRAREAELWVAAEGDALLGCVTYCPPGSPWRELAATAREGEFRMLAVHPAARGRGVGEALAGLCEERARRHGATTMVLSSLAGMTAAHRLYGRLGYTRLPGRDWSPMPDVHLIAFVKELP
jgi:ribosomal protein S18 acetylase RimI-like enzyme